MNLPSDQDDSRALPELAFACEQRSAGLIATAARPAWLSRRRTGKPIRTGYNCVFRENSHAIVEPTPRFRDLSRSATIAAPPEARWLPESAHGVERITQLTDSLKDSQ